MGDGRWAMGDGRPATGGGKGFNAFATHDPIESRALSDRFPTSKRSSPSGRRPSPIAHRRPSLKLRRALLVEVGRRLEGVCDGQDFLVLEDRAHDCLLYTS